MKEEPLEVDNICGKEDPLRTDDVYVKEEPIDVGNLFGKEDPLRTDGVCVEEEPLNGALVDKPVSISLILFTKWSSD